MTVVNSKIRKQVDIVDHPIYTNKGEQLLNVHWKDRFHSTWLEAERIQGLLSSYYMDHLVHYIDQLYKDKSTLIYPKFQKDLWNPFKSLNLKNIKVVILADESYDNVHANGLAFGNNVGPNSNTAFNQELLDIEKALSNTYSDSASIILDYTLESWMEQGVLLLNCSLISERSESNKHSFAFNQFTREILKTVSEETKNVVFLFTSPYQRQKFRHCINTSYHDVITLNELNEDTEVFVQINELLVENDGPGAEIDWI